MCKLFGMNWDNLDSFKYKDCSQSHVKSQPTDSIDVRSFKVSYALPLCNYTTITFLHRLRWRWLLWAARSLFAASEFRLIRYLTGNKAVNSHQNSMQKRERSCALVIKKKLNNIVWKKTKLKGGLHSEFRSRKWLNNVCIRTENEINKYQMFFQDFRMDIMIPRGH